MNDAPSVCPDLSAFVISGRVNPSGRLPVTMPRSSGAQPYSYLHPALGGGSSVSDLDNTPGLPFGHGLSYTAFSYDSFAVETPEVETSGEIRVSVEVTNTGGRDGAEVVQLYGHDVVASVTRPVAQLLGYARVELAAGETARVAMTVPTTRLAFTDRQLRRVVEPGAVELFLGRSCLERVAESRVDLVG